MPGLIAHYICGRNVAAALPKVIIEAIAPHRELYSVGCQGPDIFFYYFPGAIRRGTRGIGTKMHRTNIASFMQAMGQGLKELSGRAQEAAFAYFAGYLTHYALDCATHPYVYYKTGVAGNDGRKHRLKYLANHLRFETAIDTLLFKAIDNKKPKDVKLWRLIKVDKRKAYWVAGLLAGSVSKAYGVNMTAGYVMRAMGYMAFMTRLMQSRRGLRKRALSFGEALLYKSPVASSLIHQQEIKDGLDYLNEGKSPWQDPWENGDKRQESFGELFDGAIIEASQLITCLWGYVMGDISLENFLDRVGDRSLVSGRPLSDDLVLSVCDIIFD